MSIDFLSQNRPGFQVVQGDILQDPATIHVVPINCVPGVMGAGLALKYAKLIPGLKNNHKNIFMLRANEDSHNTARMMEPYLVENLWPKPGLIMFPTKEHWRHDSRVDEVFIGLAKLYELLWGRWSESEQIGIAMPALGCGYGGLEWDVVAPLISAWACGLPPRYNVRLYRTQGKT